MKNFNPLLTLLEGKKNRKLTPVEIYKRSKSRGVPDGLAQKMADAAESGKSNKDVLRNIKEVMKAKGLAKKLRHGVEKLPKGVARIIK